LTGDIINDDSVPIDEVYAELRSLAASYLKREGPDGV
jgi:hypothetical protein